MRVLIAEDDRKLAEFLRQALVEQGHAVDLASDGDEAWSLADTEAYDAIILDIMLPKRSGLDVLKSLRSGGSAVPVLVLTARDAVADKVTGLDLGADDYLTKPFALAELMARVRSLGRRKDSLHPTALTCADLVIRPETHQAFRGPRELALTPKEFALLQYLVICKGTVVTRTDIIEKVWTMDFDMFSDVLKVVVSRLRKKLTIDGEEPLIHTVRGIGYIVRESRNDHATQE